MLALLRRTSFWPPSIVYISVIIYTLHYFLQFFMLDLCGQLSCTASTPVFPTLYHDCVKSGMFLNGKLKRRTPLWKCVWDTKEQRVRKCHFAHLDMGPFLRLDCYTLLYEKDTKQMQNMTMDSTIYLNADIPSLILPKLKPRSQFFQAYKLIFLPMFDLLKIC